MDGTTPMIKDLLLMMTRLGPTELMTSLRKEVGIMSRTSWSPRETGEQLFRDGRVVGVGQETRGLADEEMLVL